MEQDEPAALVRHVAATVHGRVLVRPPAGGAPSRWLVGFHGYGQHAEAFLDMLRRVPGSEAWLLASVQALHPFYNSRTNEVIANWMTRQDRELAIADNVAYVDGVCDALEDEFGPARALVFAGFSQGVAMAYRAAVLGRRRSDCVLAVSGDVPPELFSSDAAPWPRVRMVAGTGDSFYTPERLRQDLDRLEALGVQARATTFEGGHEWTPEVIEAAAAVLAEVAATAGSPRR